MSNIKKFYSFCLFTILSLLIFSNLLYGEEIPITGSVSNIKGNVITVNIGTNHGVQKELIIGTKVSRGGDRIGQLQVTQVFGDSLYATFTPDPGKSINRGDRVDILIFKEETTQSPVTPTKAPRKFYITDILDYTDEEGSIVIIDAGRASTNIGDIYGIYPIEPVIGRLTNKDYNENKDLDKGKLKVIEVGETSSKAEIIELKPGQEVKKKDMVKLISEGPKKRFSEGELPPCRPVQIGDKIYFKTDSDEIEGKYYETLKDIAYIISLYPEKRFQIDAHADVRGSDRYNADLAARRAKSVYNALIGLGVDKEQLDIVSLSEYYPAKGPGLEGTWEKSRRTYVKVSMKEECYPQSPYSIHVSSYKTYEEAYREVNLLRIQGIESDIYIVPVKFPDTGCWFRTMVGNYSSVEVGSAYTLRNRLRSIGYPTAEVIYAPYAIVIDCFDTMKDAELAKSYYLQRNKYFPYILPSKQWKDGKEKYLLLVGAYRDLKEAKLLIHELNKEERIRHASVETRHQVILR